MKPQNEYSGAEDIVLQNNFEEDSFSFMQRELCESVDSKLSEDSEECITKEYDLDMGKSKTNSNCNFNSYNPGANGPDTSRSVIKEYKEVLNISTINQNDSKLHHYLTPEINYTVPTNENFKASEDSDMHNSNGELSANYEKFCLSVSTQTEGFISPLCGPFLLGSTKEILSNEELHLMQESIPTVRLELLKMLMHSKTQEVGLGISYKDILKQKLPATTENSIAEDATNRALNEPDKSFPVETHSVPSGLSVSQKNEMHLNKYMQQWDQCSNTNTEVKVQALKSLRRGEGPRLRIFGNGDKRLALTSQRESIIRQIRKKGFKWINQKKRDFLKKFPLVIMASPYENEVPKSDTLNC